ncbi:MAG: Hsp33 family molecular chaperone [Xanthobacteraceae bacterium]
MIDVDIPSRGPSPIPVDDAVVPFAVAALDVRGRVVRLGPALDTILSQHDYPLPVSKLLGEAIILTVLLGASLKFEGRFILQTQTNGPVRMLVVDYRSAGQIRAYAQFDTAKVAAAGDASAGDLLGRGHLAMTIDQGPEMSRYQGLVALAGGGLGDAAHEYFLRSEQIPTSVRLAVAQELRPGASGPQRRWRAGGLILQFLPKSAERMRRPDLAPGDAPEGTPPHELPEDDAWVEGQALVATLTDIELIDPDLSSDRLLYRLFHEHGVRVFRSTPVEARCSCSRERVETILRSFSAEDRREMIEDDRILVTCEFCNARYALDPESIGAE